VLFRSVCLSLLLMLNDARLLTDHQLESLRIEQDNIKRVYDLIVILCRLHDTRFNAFCCVLSEAGQQAVVDIMNEQPRNNEHNPMHVPEDQLAQAGGVERDRQVLEMEEILEADYGLPDELHRHGVLTFTECEHINHLRETDRYQVQMRISLLVGYVESHIRRPNQSLMAALANIDSFLSSLVETDQTHIVNFIMQPGIVDPATFGDNYPLNDQQRMRLHPCPRLTERGDLDSRDNTLHAMLTARGVLSQGQQNYVMADVPRNISNERLLMIMKRKSVAHAKTFCQCLNQTGQRDVLAMLNEVGIFVRIHTSINQPTMTNEDKRDREGWFVNFFNWILSARINSTMYTPFWRAVTYLYNNGSEFRYVEATGSIAWCILCRTQDALERLRHMYNTNELEHLLHDMFNSVCGFNKVLPFRVEWKADEYELCRMSFKNKSDRLFFYLDDGKGDDTEIKTVRMMSYISLYSLQSSYSLCLANSVG